MVRNYRDPRPLGVRLLNAGDRVLRALGVLRPTFTPEAIKAAAVAETGLDAFGPPDFEEGLAVFCRSLEQDAKLDLVGRRIMYLQLRRVLSNRLLWVDFKNRHPEVLETPLAPPLVIVGLPRTGSTFLYQLLGQDPAGYAPPTWQMWRPLPRVKGPDERRQITESALKGLHKLVPSLPAKHAQLYDDPDECYHLLNPSCRAPGLSMLCAASAYWEWSLSVDMAPAYRMYREYLQIFSAEMPGRRMTLKAPLHTPYLEDIEAVIPGTLFVQTHRDPVEGAGSFASLVCSLHSATSTRVDPKRLGPFVVGLMRRLVDRSTEQRDRLALQIVDVDYRDLVSDPLGVLRSVYAGHGLSWSDELEQVLVKAVKDRPQHQHGRHRYDLADFGLDADQISEQFADYTERYLPGARGGVDAVQQRTA